MANLNLSEFGEKLFVADADHTFIWDSAVSISKRVSRNSWLNSGTLTSDAPVTISQTWNQIGTAFTAFKVNATNTTSLITSKLLDLQLGGVSKVFVTRDGTLTGTLNATGFGSNQLYTTELSATGIFAIVSSFSNTNFIAEIGVQNKIVCNAATQFGWGSQGLDGGNGVALRASMDTILLRDGAPNTLALRNGASAQTFNVYGTSSASNANYARLALTCGLDGNATISTQALGTGTAGVLAFSPGNSERMRITTAGNVGIGTTAPAQKLEVWGNSGPTISKVTSVSPGTGSVLWLDGPVGQVVTSTGNFFLTNQSVTNGIVFETNLTEKMRITASGNVGIGTTSPTSKLHVAGSSSPSITVDNTLATGASQLLFKNTVVTGDTNGIFLNGSTQTGLGGASSLNIKATNGPLAFHTNTITNALSIAQNGLATFNAGLAVSGSVDVTLIRSGYYIQTNTQFIFGSGGIADVGFSRTSAGVAEVNSGTAGTFRDLRVRSVIQQPPATITPDTNGDLVVEATSNTTLTFKLKGTDGTVRTGTITLA